MKIKFLWSISGAKALSVNPGANCVLTFLKNSWRKTIFKFWIGDPEVWIPATEGENTSLSGVFVPM